MPQHPNELQCNLSDMINNEMSGMARLYGHILITYVHNVLCMDLPKKQHKSKLTFYF